jgi:glycosyltransferase involved in cell wall biosynthesis
VVATDCPSGPSEILADGRYGKLARVGDPQGLAAAILKTLSSPIQKSVLKKRAQKFSIDDITQQYLDVLVPENKV